MTYFDYVVIAVISLSFLIGVWRGVVGEIIALVAWALAVFAVMEWGDLAGNMAFQSIADSGVRVMAGSASVFVLVLILMALVRMVIKRIVSILGLTLSDRLLGAIFGLMRGLLVTLVLVAIGGMTSLPQQGWWRSSVFAAPLETAVLVAKAWLPDDLSKRIRFS